MSSILTAKDEDSIAFTIHEALASKAKSLNLAGTDVEELSIELKALVHLTRLNLSDNPLAFLNISNLPPNIVHLSLTGCNLDSLPDSITYLQELKVIDIGANRLSNINVLFHCPSLLHIGCAYNEISALPATPSNVVSLDLSHNNLTDFDPTILLITQAAPKLQSLSLTGNPICLIPRYEILIRRSLKTLGLKYLDGIKQDIIGGSRPSTNNSQASVSPRVSSSGTLGLTADESWNLRIELSSLAPSIDPFAEQRAAMDEWLLAMAAAAPEKGKGKADPPPPPPDFQSLQPIEYCVEFSIDGTEYATIPLILRPPSPPPAPSPEAKKAPAAKAGGAAKGKGVVEDVAPPPPQLARGSMILTLPIQADLKWRDFLRKGLAFKLVCTRHEAVPLEPSDVEKQQQDQKPAASPSPAKGKGGGKGKAEVETPTPPPPVKIVSSQVVAGTANFTAPKLVTGRATSQEGTAAFVPIPRLWDGRGIRLGLEDPSQDKLPVATMTCKFSLSL